MENTEESEEKQKEEKSIGVQESLQQPNIKIKKSKLNYQLILSVVLAIILLINVIIIVGVQKSYTKALAEAKEKSKPALISLTILRNSNCKDCFNLNQVIDSIKDNNVDVTSERTLEFSDPEAKALISKNEITKLPTVLVTGEIDKTGEMGLIKKEDTLVFEDIRPVYYDLVLNKEVGKVSLVHIKDSGCKDCSDISSLITQLVRAGVIMTDEKTLEFTQAEELITKYKITKLPTMIFSSDLDAYIDNQIIANWKQFGSIESDSSYIVRQTPPPYKDLLTNSVRGLVELTYITDKSCNICYNVSLHKPILLNFGVFLSNEKTIDVSSPEGQALITKYKITKAPTIIMSNEADVYSSLKEAWSQVGSIETDNYYIFRNLDILQVPYKDLNTNKVVEPKLESNQQPNQEVT
ncbi:hypothetical protein HYX18_04460 [Candidatus Woesearchaeota archaeon]|nr:hypothetical protein [Candidatus Woesearchaeota archaeon]